MTFRFFLLCAVLLLYACDGDGLKKDAGKVGDGMAAMGDALTGDGAKASDDGAPPAKTTGEVGSPCNSDADCKNPPDAKCFKTIGGGMAPKITFPNGYCSKACDMKKDTKCGKGGCASIGLSGSGGGSATLTMCAASCKKDDDCRKAEGYKCLILLFGFGVCVPP